MTQSEARKQFKRIWSDAVRANPKMRGDIPAKNESFGYFIDALNRDGKITDKQYATWTLS